MAYKAEKFFMPSVEMEKLMLTHTAIIDDDLRQLASQRALKVKDYILKSGQVEPDRLFFDGIKVAGAREEGKADE